MWQHVVETMLGSKAQLDSQLQRVPVHSDRECMASGKLAPRIYVMADCIGGEGSRESPVQVISPFVDWMTWVFWCLFFCSSVSTFDIEFQVWSVVSEDVFPQPAGCFSHWLIISCAKPKHWISGDPICQFLVLFGVVGVLLQNFLPVLLFWSPLPVFCFWLSQSLRSHFTVCDSGWVGFCSGWGRPFVSLRVET